MYIFFLETACKSLHNELVSTTRSPAFIALSIVGILWCSGAVTTYSDTNKKTGVTTTYNTTCPNNKAAAIVTASLAVVDYMAITVCSIVGLVLYHLYFRSYGIKGNGQC